MVEAPTVYVVDDNADHREILFQLLGQAGFNVQTYSSGTEFLKLTQWNTTGCILLDNQMPGISGLQVQAELRKRQCDIPIIFVSGRSMIPDAVQAVKEGALGFLEKPIRSKELIEYINKALEHCAAQGANKKARLNFEHSFAKLTSREKQVYDLVIRGKTNKMIASELEIKLGTVEFHRANMMDKMGVQTFSDLMELTHTANPLAKE